jgi:hypothetical protein
MIGEFCPKSFALRRHLAIGLDTIVPTLPADASADSGS